MIRALIVVAAMLGLLWAGGLLARAENPRIIEGRVTVIDGDTFRILSTRIRLHGLDCPELSQPGGREAREYLYRLTFGELVRCEPVETDRYGRTVARCRRNGNPVSLTCEMIRSGLCARYARYDRRGEYLECERAR